MNTQTYGRRDNEINYLSMWQLPINNNRDYAYETEGVKKRIVYKNGKKGDWYPPPPPKKKK